MLCWHPKILRPPAAAAAAAMPTGTVLKGVPNNIITFLASLVDTLLAL
jgi:hypothetical protein